MEVSIVKYSIGLLLFCAIIFMLTVKEFTKNDKSFITKKVIDILVFTTFYIIVAILYKFSLDYPQFMKKLRWVNIGIVVLYVIKIVGFLWELGLFKKNIRHVHNTSLKLMVISVVIGLFISISGLYFNLYIAFPNWFNLNNVKVGDWLGTAFEFIYFTFTVTITYSGSGIELIGVIPKIVQMIHILIFYLFAGEVIMSLITNRSKQD